MMKNILFAIWILLIIVAMILSFFSFMFRADSWKEVADARFVNFVMIGPLWAIIAFAKFRWLQGSNLRNAIAASCLAYLIPASCISGWTALVLKVRSGPEMTKADAREYFPVVRAICDYRAEKGMLPYSFDDLVPEYLPQPPQNPRLLWQNQMLTYRYALLYRFDGSEEGWPERLNLPIVEPSRPIAEGKSLIRARIGEYNRRIETDPSNSDHSIDLIAYLIEVDQRSRALEVSRAAAKAFPGQWRPLMGIALLAEPAERERAETELKIWFDNRPAFIRYWCLSRYYRTLDRPTQALEALRQAVKCPLESIPDESRYVPNAYAMDAANYAYERREYELVIDIANVWAAPQGIYTNPGSELYAFRAAAELALGRLADARNDMKIFQDKTGGGCSWVGNIPALQQAVDAGDLKFVYNPGCRNLLSDWKMFPYSIGN